MPRRTVSLFHRVERALETIDLGSTPLDTIHETATFLAEIHPNGTLLYCNAGHPPALLIRGDGTADRLRATGMILGPTPSATYSIGIAEMKPGDVLILYTDGITEARVGSSDEEYGEDRLVHVARAARHRDPVAVVDRIFSDVTEFADGAPPSDDQTILVVKRRPEELEEAPA